MASRKNMPERRQARREGVAQRFAVRPRGEHEQATDYIAYVGRVERAQANLLANIAKGG